MSGRNVLNKLLDPIGDLLTPEVAARLAAFQADAATQAKLDELADKAQTGQLSQDDAREYDEYLAAIDLITVLQVKARRVLQKQSVTA